jgi:hypothetical protein
MPTDLLHLEDADLDVASINPRLLAAFRSYLPQALAERRGLAILAPATANAHMPLVVLARRIGVALRDANIHLRDSGGDLKTGRQKLCYLPGGMLGAALGSPESRDELVREAACFIQDLDSAWAVRQPGLEPATLLAFLDKRLAAGRPTFLNASPDRLPPGLEAGLRARLPILED